MASEYTHKETLNRTYIGYKNQVENINDNGKLKEQLLRIILESAELNPSKVLGGKGEIPTLSLLEKIIDILPIKKLKKLQNHINKKMPNMGDSTT